MARYTKSKYYVALSHLVAFNKHLFSTFQIQAIIFPPADVSIPPTVFIKQQLSESYFIFSNAAKLPN